MKKAIALLVLLFPGVSTQWLSLFFLAASTFASEDLACIGAGILIARGELGAVAGIAACFVGIFLGDIWLFLMGRLLGRAALTRWPFRTMISREDVDRATTLFATRGASLVFASRFLPGSRLPVYFAAGLLRTNFWKFCGYFVLACLVWTPLLVGASVLLQHKLLQAFDRFANGSFFVIAVIAGAYILLRVSRKALNPRRRKLLLSTWRRWTRWEFWPMWLFYPPVVLYIAWLAIRHRGLTVFAAANPGIPGGGFAGESKSQILDSLSGAGEYIAKHETVRSAQDAFRSIQAAGWSYPVVLKPDQGERGSGVVIARSDADIHSYFASTPGLSILQEYIAGFEFGVFYVRYPNEKNGSIFAITDKRFPSVTGDGAQTLEQLILNDDRAVCMARFHLQKHAAQLQRVIPAGEDFRLVELGTHCKGSLFLEGIHVKTPALEAKIDEVSKHFSGFYFGRYDIRTPSLEDFARGRNFKVVELNGVTSEATSIYDPKYGLFHAYRVLMQQWKIAFEIGAQNRARKAEIPAVSMLLAMASRGAPDLSG